MIGEVEKIPRLGKYTEGGSRPLKVKFVSLGPAKFLFGKHERGRGKQEKGIVERRRKRNLSRTEEERKKFY